MADNKQYWNNIYSNCKHNKPKYDLWLDKHRDILDTINNETILDLGCGAGGDTLYLLERGYKVLSCDNSEEALSAVNLNIPNAKIKNINLIDRLPFEDKSIALVIADLSLHYFDDKTTKSIIKEIDRILKKSAYLILRVNSVKDTNYGAMQGKKIENHFYFTEAGYKRFFDEEDIKAYFNKWDILYLKEETITRYGNDKKAFEVVVKKK